MYACPKCARVLDDTRFANLGTCPACGAEVTGYGDQEWCAVARVTNLAEAGFLADELAGIGIDAKVHQSDEFSAVADRWRAAYVICVPAKASGDAAARIREHMHDSAGRYQESPLESNSAGATSFLESGGWRPVALVLLAGVTSFVMGQRFSEMRDRQHDDRQTQTALNAAMAQIDQPFVTDRGMGEPVHRIYYDSRNKIWFLDTDREGDGRYDARTAFRASGAVVNSERATRVRRAAE